MTTQRVNSRMTDTMVLVGFVVLSYCIAAIGGLSTASSVKGWYAEILKPAWTPPNWVFGPVWTVLYGIIAWSGWRFFRAEKSPLRLKVLKIYGLQLALNALWSPVFFGAQQYLAGAVVILALAVAIGVLILRGRSLDPLAAWLLTPYLVWVTYASSLNIGIYVLNP